MIFDTHCHYGNDSFSEDRRELLSGLRDKGIGFVVEVGADMSSSRFALELSKEVDFVYAALGVHPSEVGNLAESDMDWIQTHADEEKVVAIGEIGLDYHTQDVKPDVQKKWFRRQIHLAKETGLPIIIHSRDAAADTMEIIRGEKAYDCGGVIHCYSYSPEMAKEYTEMGFYIGVGGVVTFKNAKKLKQTVETIPLERIVLETDCPYLAPEPHRGSRNDSGNLMYVADAIAELKNITAKEVICTTTENAFKMYRKGSPWRS